ncbi:transmembrane protein 234 homolog [Anabrus simplex]|uniref:transmembrane protein 234 homolog n=1 Tax=Anabrus simplex TaxID=316456 RepID=UPI0034DD5E30
MSGLLEVYCSLVLVGVFWGATNPLIKKGCTGLEKVKARNVVLQFVKELLFLLGNWKFVVPFLLNQCGSVLYFFTLSKSDLTMAVPVANSLTFVFTALVGWALGEEQPDKGTIWGMLLVLAGITLCMIDGLGK